MKSRIFSLLLSVLVVAAAATAAHAGYISRSEIQEQTKNFKQWWDTDLEWRVEKLPAKGKVPKERMPYAGYIYPDKQGGCGYVLNKWDRAFNWGRGSAAGYERTDIASTKDTTTRAGGLFGWRQVTRTETPDWAGHCNGWVSAAIRHAEPQKSVVRRGVVFTPADIKSLMAEAYVYNETVNLGGEGQGAVNPGILHLVLANWLGNGQHPLGMDSSVGKEVWNFPIYGYSSSIAKRGERQYEVRTNIGWVNMLQQEFHRAPRNNSLKRMHYMLYVDSAGRVIGGDYMGDSERVDMLWVPRQLFQGGKDGNQRGNPYVNATELLAMWRESVPEERRLAYWNIDPTDEDAIHVEEAVEEQLAAEGSGSDAEAAAETAEATTEATEETNTEEVAEAVTDEAADGATDVVVEESTETAATTELAPALEAPVTDEAAEVEAEELETTDEAAAVETEELDEAEAATTEDEAAEVDSIDEDEAPALETARSFSGREISERSPDFRR